MDGNQELLSAEEAPKPTPSQRLVRVSRELRAWSSLFPTRLLRAVLPTGLLPNSDQTHPHKAARGEEKGCGDRRKYACRRRLGNTLALTDAGVRLTPPPRARRSPSRSNGCFVPSSHCEIPSSHRDNPAQLSTKALASDTRDFITGL